MHIRQLRRPSAGQPVRARHYGAALALAVLLILGGCGRNGGTTPTETLSAARENTPESAVPARTEEEETATAETGEEETMFYIQIGDTTLTAAPADTEAADALMELLEDGPLTVRVENYGGFEKVGELPQALARQDTRITTRPGDIMLYQGDSIVLFYGSNTWSYTRLGTILDVSGSDLAAVLGGAETQIILSK